MRKILGYGRQSIDDSDVNAVIDILKNGALTCGPAVTRFEEALAEYVDAPFVSAVSNGTAALHLASMALQLGPGDAVIVPALTFAATANSVLYCGATPVFADIDPNTWGLCIESVKDAFHLAKSKGLSPKAIYPVHFGGFPVNMRPLYDFARENNLSIVEDACHAIGAEYRLGLDKEFCKVGSGQLADLSIFSFHPVKHITTGEGGAVTTANEDLYRRIQDLKTHGITKDPQKFQHRERAVDGQSEKINPWYMEMHSLGYNYRLSDILAALGVSQLKRAGDFLQNRLRIAQYYHDNLTEFGGKPVEYELGKGAFHLYPICINYEELGTSRADFMGLLRERGVPSQVHYIPVYWHPYYQQNASKWMQVSCSKTEELYAQLLSLPMYQDMVLEDAAFVVDVIRELTR